jgi:DNA polymerase III delta prime subunit
MHAYLLIGRRGERLDKEVEKLSQVLRASLIKFPLVKIEDVRSLNSLTSLKVGSPEVIYISDIEAATHAAQNAFLKSLEEPQENLYYILSSSSIHKVLPTIVSRCQIIQVKSEMEITRSAALKVKSKILEEFIRLTIAERLVFIDKFKKREEGIKFLNELILFWHNMLVEINGDSLKLAHNLKRALRCTAALKANGNVLLQLTNFVININ